MSWTAEQAIASALRAAPEFRSAPGIPVDVRVGAFNDALADVLDEIVEADPEMLLLPYPVETAVIEDDEDTVDLTATVVDDVVTTGQRKWLHIEHIGWTTDAESDEDDEVWLLTAADRFGSDEVEGEVTARLDGDFRTLRKLDGWDDIIGLVIHGVLEPTVLTEDTIESATYNYVRSVMNVVKWQMVMEFADFAGVSNALRLGRWNAELQRAREKIGLVATRPVGNRVEQIHPSSR